MWLVAGLLLLVAGLAWWWRFGQPHHEFDRHIRFAAERYGVDAALIKAVVWQESRFRPEVVGKAGEIGLMQVTEAAAQEWASDEGVFPLDTNHLFDPRTNILAGAWYLRWCLGHYRRVDDPLPFALAEYNAGRGNVLRWLDGRAATNSAAFVAAIGFPSTRRYVESVLRRRLACLADFPGSLTDRPVH